MNEQPQRASPRLSGSDPESRTGGAAGLYPLTNSTNT